MRRTTRAGRHWNKLRATSEIHPVAGWVQIHCRIIGNREKFNIDVRGIGRLFNHQPIQIDSGQIVCAVHIQSSSHRIETDILNEYRKFGLEIDDRPVRTEAENLQRKKIGDKKAMVFGIHQDLEGQSIAKQIRASDHFPGQAIELREGTLVVNESGHDNHAPARVQRECSDTRAEVEGSLTNTFINPATFRASDAFARKARW